MRPDIVWFGESLSEEVLGRAFEAARSAEVALSIGTSSVVYPAAGLPQLTRSSGGFVIEVNLEPTPLTPLADVFLAGKAAEIVPRLVEATQ